MTKKCEDFLAELESLCCHHEVTISPSMYDSLQVWDRVLDEDTLNFPDIEDRTIGGRDVERKDT